MRLRPPARYARRAPDAGRDGGGVRQRLRASRQAVSWSIHRGDDSTREGDRARLEGHLLQRFLVRRLADLLDLRLAQFKSVDVGERVWHSVDERVGRAGRMQEIGE